jgi:GNAT superfamily N-acetyltransferase
VRIVEVAAEATYDLRRQVLREGRADAEVAFDGDDAAGAHHLAVVDDRERPLAVATATPATCRRREGRRGWKVRGMAVAPEHQGRGLGRRLLDEIEVRAAAAGVEVVWADARDDVLAFYERHHWSVEGEGYVTPATGLTHHMVILDLAPANSRWR